MKRTKKKPITALMIATILLLSAFAALATIPKATAYTGNTIYVENGGSNTTFQRVWCSFYDGMLGEPAKSLDYHDTARIHANADLWVNFMGYVTAHVSRYIHVYDSSGNCVAYSGEIDLYDEGLGYTWQDNYQNFDYVHYDYLNLRCDGVNEGLRYDFSWAPNQFAGYKWVVTYVVILTSYNIFGNYLDSAALVAYPTLTHDETSPDHTYNFEMCPEDTPDYAATVSWTNTYGSAYVIDASNVCGSAPDGNCAQFGAYASNSHAFICTHLSGYAFGGIWVKCESVSTQSDFLVYVSSDGNSWTLTKEQTLYYVPGLHWVDCGINTGGYSYVLLAVYDNGSPSQMYIDAIQTGVNPT